MHNIFKKKKIRTSRTFGKILICSRKKMNISLQKAEQDTKVRYKYLEALEADNFSQMPADVYNIGFLNRYCNYLKLNSKKIISQYIIERKIFENLKQKNSLFRIKSQSTINPGNPENYRERLRFVFTPQTIISIIVVFIVLGILGFIWLQVKSFAAPPPLELKNPNEQIMVSMKTVGIEGYTDPTVNLEINNQQVGIESSGYFKEEVQLTNGINNIEIKATNKAGKETIKNIQVLATENK